MEKPIDDFKNKSLEEIQQIEIDQDFGDDYDSLYRYRMLNDPIFKAIQLRKRELI